MVMPAIAPLPPLSLPPTIQTDKTKIAGQGQASSLSPCFLVSFCPFPAAASPRAPLDFAGLFRALSWTAAVVVGRPAAGQIPTTVPPSERATREPAPPWQYKSFEECDRRRAERTTAEEEPAEDRSVSVEACH